MQTSAAVAKRSSGQSIYVTSQNARNLPFPAVGKNARERRIMLGDCAAERTFRFVHVHCLYCDGRLEFPDRTKVNRPLGRRVACPKSAQKGFRRRSSPPCSEGAKAPASGTGAQGRGGTTHRSVSHACDYFQDFEAHYKLRTKAELSLTRQCGPQRKAKPDGPLWRVLV
jgi:hypothetical protein